MGELAKRALKWPKHFSNMAAAVTLDPHSTKSYLLQRKLIFLRRQLIVDSIDSNRIAMKSLSDDPESLCLVKECRELESHFNTAFTSEIDWCRFYRPHRQKEIYQEEKIDKDLKLEMCALKAPFTAQVVTAGGSWPKLWDSTSVLHLGSKHLKGLQNLTTLMEPCPLCDALTHPLIEYVLTQHHRDFALSSISDSPLSTDKLLTVLVDCDIRFVYKLWSLLNNYLLSLLFTYLCLLYTRAPCRASRMKHWKPKKLVRLHRPCWKKHVQKHHSQCNAD